MEKNLIDELIDEAGGSGQDETYQFTTSRGRTITARRLRSADEIQAVLRRAKTLTKRTKANTPAQWHPYLPISESTARSIAFLEKCLVDKLSTVDCLRLSKEAGAYFLEIAGEVTAGALLAQMQRDEDQIDDLGEDSGETV